MQRPATPNEYDRRIQDIRLSDDLVATPAAPPDHFLSNLVRKVLANLLIVVGGRTKMVQGTPEGAIYTYRRSPKKTYTETGTAADAEAYSVLGEAYGPHSGFSVWVKTHPMYVYIYFEDGSYDAFLLSANEFFSIELDFKGLSVKNGTPGSNATYQIMYNIRSR